MDSATAPVKVGVESPRPQHHLSEEAVITTHRLFVAFDGGKRSLSILAADAFDSRLSVARSAIDAMGAMGDLRALPHLVRILQSKSQELVRGALSALGAFKSPKTRRLLREVLNNPRFASFRIDVLEKLAVDEKSDPTIIELVRSGAWSPANPPAVRLRYVTLYFTVAGMKALDDLLSDNHAETVQLLLLAAGGSAGDAEPALRNRIAAHFGPRYGLLPPDMRKTFSELAANCDDSRAAEVLLQAIEDSDLGVRKAAFQILGSRSNIAPVYGRILSHLAETMENDPTVEDEVLRTIARFHEHPEAAFGPSLRLRLYELIEELFSRLSAPRRHPASEGHELGWLIARSKEYIEYYCDEDFKAALARRLRGAGTETVKELLAMLKATAVRVEVRHFDGYSALADLIKAPARNGIGLVTREIALTPIGTGMVFRRLIRVLRLALLFEPPAPASKEAARIKEIFGWSKDQRLYRLAEAALTLVAAFDPSHALIACRETLTKPAESKILTIASLHLIAELAPGDFDSFAAEMLKSQEDPYLLMNTVDIVRARPPVQSEILADAILGRYACAADREVSAALLNCLRHHLDVDVSERVKELATTVHDVVCAGAISVLDAQVPRADLDGKARLIEFLYGILRASHGAAQSAAAVLLWKLGDDYGITLIRDFIANGDDEEVARILRGLNGHVTEPLVDAIMPSILRESALVHDALREVVLQSNDGSISERLVRFALGARGWKNGEPDTDLADTEAMTHVAVASERAAYVFEHESMRAAVIFFSDIQGYSKKAQELSPMDLAALLRDYEDVLLSHVESHGGRLVKRMGDGHLVTFDAALDAVLAGIRLQKSLVRFNRYRGVESRIVIRIGIHAGTVVSTASGDVLGNDVNIASRLESSATPGSILVSARVYGDIREYVHAREIGKITVKNIKDPIMTYEPYEILIELPAERDPLKSRSKLSTGRDVTPHLRVPKQTMVEIAKCFDELTGLCRAAGDQDAPVAALLKDIASRWARIRPEIAAKLNA